MRGTTNTPSHLPMPSETFPSSSISPFSSRSYLSSPSSSSRRSSYLSSHAVTNSPPGNSPAAGRRTSMASTRNTASLRASLSGTSAPSFQSIERKLKSLEFHFKAQKNPSMYDVIIKEKDSKLESLQSQNQEKEEKIQQLEESVQKLTQHNEELTQESLSLKGRVFELEHLLQQMEDKNRHYKERIRVLSHKEERTGGTDEDTEASTHESSPQRPRGTGSRENSASRPLVGQASKSPRKSVSVPSTHESAIQNTSSPERPSQIIDEGDANTPKELILFNSFENDNVEESDSEMESLEKESSPPMLPEASSFSEQGRESSSNRSEKTPSSPLTNIHPDPSNTQQRIKMPISLQEEIVSSPVGKKEQPPLKSLPQDMQEEIVTSQIGKREIAPVKPLPTELQQEIVSSPIGKQQKPPLKLMPVLLQKDIHSSPIGKQEIPPLKTLPEDMKHEIIASPIGKQKPPRNSLPSNLQKDIESKATVGKNDPASSTYENNESKSAAETSPPRTMHDEPKKEHTADPATEASSQSRGSQLKSTEDSYKAMERELMEMRSKIANKDHWRSQSKDEEDGELDLSLEDDRLSESLSTGNLEEQIQEMLSVSGGDVDIRHLLDKVNAMDEEIEETDSEENEV